MEYYNQLFLLHFAEDRIRNNGRTRKRAVFQCDCGDISEYDYSSVKNGRPKQCRNCGYKLVSQSKRKHNKIKHPLYRKWQDMKKRCYNKSVERYKNYGGRGITVCKAWKNDFMIFYNWCMENGWKPGLEIDRLNNDGSYNPSNCRITNHRENGYNKTNSRRVKYNGKLVSIAKVVNDLGLEKEYQRIYYNVVRMNRPINEVISSVQK